MSAVEVLNSQSGGDPSEFTEVNKQWAEQLMNGGISGAITPNGTVLSERNSKT